MSSPEALSSDVGIDASALDEGRQLSLMELASRVEDAGDVLERLACLASLAAAISAAIVAGLREARDARVSAAAVGRSLGISRQAVHQRFVALDAPEPGSTPERPGEPEVEVEVERKSGRARSSRASSGTEWSVRTPGGRTLLRVTRENGGRQ